MLMSQESLDALSQELGKPVAYDSFRPNILVEGTPGPWAEDFWNVIRIGDEAAFKYYLPCSR
jgi:uncharacterized protein YcbX